MKRPKRRIIATLDAARKRAASRHRDRIRAIEDRVIALETAVKRQDRHFGRMLAPIVNAAGEMKLIQQDLTEQKRMVALLYRGVDALLKAFNPKGEGMAAIEREAV